MSRPRIKQLQDQLYAEREAARKMVDHWREQCYSLQSIVERQTSEIYMLEAELRRLLAKIPDEQKARVFYD